VSHASVWLFHSAGVEMFISLFFIAAAKNVRRSCMYSSGKKLFFMNRELIKPRMERRKNQKPHQS
jgi:hypothetical protein